ncbi:hypothetical protein H310_00360 [Aphanomyces invadans]|uniref:Chromodomain-helicase-DNA-binding protein 7 n=1 Tax=Aphanomyces invadans TaxID=157072 RepID=A0A024UVK0_9STRA|nr:hypothetical protein H310_00360 [Aphanomyces invadans]ETW09932.1 hypothetical protein H310_00360 [Aphanomyces invadans]|eukprot:XP_008861343.1 hypothetical protein H310_00360 [Aphanomyces invadans]
MDPQQQQQPSGQAFDHGGRQNSYNAIPASNNIMSSFPSQDPIMEPNSINLRPSAFNWNTPSETALPSMQSLDLSNPHAAAASSMQQSQQMPGMGQNLHIQTQFPQMQHMPMPYATNNNPMSMGMVMNNHGGGMGQQHNIQHHQQGGGGLALRSPMALSGGADHMIPHMYQHHPQQHHNVPQQHHHMQQPQQGYASPMPQTYGAQDPMKLNNIMSAPVQAPTSAVQPTPIPSRLPSAASGFPSTYEFEVVLQKGEHGLCMNMGIKMGSVSVLGFRQPLPGVIGPAEACGMIQVGDDLVCVDGIMLNSSDDFKKVVPHLKSDLPAKLRFRRSPQPQQQQQAPMFQPLTAPVIPSLTGTGSSGKVYQINEIFMGVRYLGPNQWAAEVKTHQGDQQLQRLGEFATEYLAAQAYNAYLLQTYGQQAMKYMHPATRHQNSHPMPQHLNPHQQQQQHHHMMQMQQQQHMMQQQHHRMQQQQQQHMKPQPPRPRGPILHAMFTVEQKEQLRAQIMVFKFSTSGSGIPTDLLRVAVRGAGGELEFNTGPKERSRKKTFNDTAPKNKRMKFSGGRSRAGRNRGRGRGALSDDDDEGDFKEDDDDDTNEVADNKPEPNVRRSSRNQGKEKKRYSEVADIDLDEEEMPRETSQQQEKEDQGPQMDKIIAVRFVEPDMSMEFLMKWKHFSYLHVTWLSTADIEGYGKGAVMRMRRYMQKNARDVEVARMNPSDRSEETTHYFSPAYVEVDRILDMAPVEEIVNHETREFRRGIKYLIKWRDLSYAECSWEWAENISDDRKIATYQRYNHPPLLENAPRAMFEDIRPHASQWAKYPESPMYNENNTLRSYQLEGLNWMVFCWYNRRNCILADEMGLGKTVQATAILEHLRQHEHIRGPFLVVAPLATLGNWKREIEGWTSMNCVVYHDSEGGADTRAFIRQHEFYYKNQPEYYKRNNVYKFNVLVTSYQTLMADAELLQEIRWRYIVIDEAHKLKNRDAKLLASLRTFNWDSCLLMTGTPLQNGVFELWCLLNFIEPEKFPSQQEFYNQYGDLSSAEQVASLHEQLRPFMLRRVKEDVEKSIPPKEETIIDVELTTMQKKYYRAIFERNRSFLNQGSNVAVANLMNVEMELRKCCNHPFLIRGVEQKELANIYHEADRSRVLIQASGKLVLLEKMLSKFKAEGKKVLVFSQFKIMLDILEDLFHARHYSFERLDGSLLGNARQAAIDRFNDPKSDTFVFLLSTRAGGVGINLIAASIVVLFDSDWNPQNDLQAIARCHRIGQTQAVRIFRLVTKKTYEAQMFEIASKKLGMHHAVFETGGVRKDFDGSDDSNMMSLMSLDKDKVEMMIRYGAYAIMNSDEEDPENAKINELDIDQLLSSSRTIRYDPTGNKEEATGNALSFSKATFTAETSDATIDFEDAQFWDKVLGPKTIQLLTTQVENGSLLQASLPEIKAFLTSLRELARQLVKNRQKGEKNPEAEQILSILIELKVRGPVNKQVNVKTIASDWLEVIERPKRRRNQEVESELMYHPFLDDSEMDGDGVGGGSGGGGGSKKSKKKQKTSSGHKLRVADQSSAIVVTIAAEGNGYRVVRVHSDKKEVNRHVHVDVEEADHASDEDALFSDEDDYDEKPHNSRHKDSSKKKQPAKELSRRPVMPKPLETIDGVPVDELWCRVCYSDQGFDDDPIVQCEKCKCSVHKFCYGIVKVPEGDLPWYCDLCDAHMAAETVPQKCIMCPLEVKETAFKETVDKQWVHVVCALWSRGVEFEDIERMKGLKNVQSTMDAMEDATKAAPCALCERTSGSKIKCCRNGCDVHFHALCGRQTFGVYDMYMNDAGNLRSFCKEHRPKFRPRLHNS